MVKNVEAVKTFLMKMDVGVKKSRKIAVVVLASNSAIFDSSKEGAVRPVYLLKI